MKPTDSNLIAQSRVVPIDTIVRNSRNPRTHSKKQIAKIASSIRNFSFLNPIIVDEDNTVLAGHGRLEAAQLEGLTHVPIVSSGHLTSLQKRAYLIADNKIAEEAGWNRELLAIELNELADLLPVEDMDISVTGFATTEIDLLLADMASSPPADEHVSITLPPHAVTRDGDFWQLGKHRLTCADAQKGETFSRLLAGTLVDAAFCDPPNTPSRSLPWRNP